MGATGGACRRHGRGRGRWGRGRGRGGPGRSHRPAALLPPPGGSACAAAAPSCPCAAAAGRRGGRREQRVGGRKEETPLPLPQARRGDAPPRGDASPERGCRRGASPPLPVLAPPGGRGAGPRGVQACPCCAPRHLIAAVGSSVCRSEGNTKQKKGTSVLPVEGNCVLQTCCRTAELWLEEVNPLEQPGVETLPGWHRDSC